MPRVNQDVGCLSLTNEKELGSCVLVSSLKAD